MSFDSVELTSQALPGASMSSTSCHGSAKLGRHVSKQWDIQISTVFAKLENTLLMTWQSMNHDACQSMIHDGSDTVDVPTQTGTNLCCKWRETCHVMIYSTTLMNDNIMHDPRLRWHNLCSPPQHLNSSSPTVATLNFSISICGCLCEKVVWQRSTRDTALIASPAENK